MLTQAPANPTASEGSPQNIPGLVSNAACKASSGELRRELATG